MCPAICYRKFIGIVNGKKGVQLSREYGKNDGEADG
jgi:hypothetical protein